MSIPENSIDNEGGYLRRFLKKLKSGLASKEGKLKAVILLIGFMILGLIITLGALELTSTPQFCQSCHEMRPEYVTWKASAHSQIRCVECHIEPGNGKFLMHKVKSVKELYKHFSGQVYAPITSSEPIKDIVCERCHTSNRVATPSGDIIIPHKAHKENEVPCVKCHQAVAHAKIGEEGFTKDGDWTKWVEPLGRAYMRKDFLKFSMSDCLKCHNEEGAGPKLKECKACHNKLVKPDNHAEPMFISQHGETALQDLNKCDKCHKVTMSEKKIRSSSDNATVLYAKQNEFCSECHTQKRPPDHKENWRLVHSLRASENREGCFACHDEGKSTSKSVATKTYCYQCHVAKIHNVIRLGHPKFPLGPNPVLTANPCFACHSAPSCLKCHYVPNQDEWNRVQQYRQQIDKPGASGPNYNENIPSSGSNKPHNPNQPPGSIPAPEPKVFETG